MPKQKKMAWPLPTVVHPPETVCFQVNVPKESAYLMAFYGAMFLLSKPYAWQNDSAHTAIEVGKVWRAIFDQLQENSCECPPGVGIGIFLEEPMGQQIQLKPGDPCIIQMWCIDHWEDWYNPSGCVGGQLINPTDGIPPAAGECKEWDVTLAANGRWPLPVPVSAGFTIEISGVDGSWSDGTLAWFCGDGSSFVLGACIGGGSFIGGDPLPAAKHMALILGQNSGSPSYSLAYNSTAVVAPGVLNGDAWIQANDSAIGDDSGVLTFHVKVCGASVPSGTHIFDFTVSDGGWFARSGHACTYVAAVGWEQGCDTPGTDVYSQVTIQHAIVSAGRITAVRVTFDRVYAGFNDGADGGYAVKNFVEGGGGTAIGVSASMATGSPIVDNFNANPVDMLTTDYLVVAEVCGYLHARGNCASLSPGSVTITKIEVDWVGADPF